MLTFKWQEFALVARKQVGVALALVLFGGGCGEIDGRETPFPGTVIHESPTGSYRFHYLSPPWLVALVNGDSVDMGIPPLGLGKLPTSLNDLPYRLHVEAQAQDYQQAVSQVFAAGMNKRSIRDHGDKEIGMDLVWTDNTSGLHHREAFLRAATPGRCYRMAFSGREQIDDPMISTMISSFTLLPSGGAQ